jgi:hypothetical protein
VLTAGELHTVSELRGDAVGELDASTDEFHGRRGSELATGTVAALFIPVVSWPVGMATTNPRIQMTVVGLGRDLSI